MNTSETIMTNLWKAALNNLEILYQSCAEKHPSFTWGICDAINIGPNSVYVFEKYEKDIYVFNNLEAGLIMEDLKYWFGERKDAGQYWWPNIETIIAGFDEETGIIYSDYEPFQTSAAFGERVIAIQLLIELNS